MENLDDQEKPRQSPTRLRWAVGPGPCHCNGWSKTVTSTSRPALRMRGEPNYLTDSDRVAIMKGHMMSVE
ncbi:hypothetical protein EVAR_4542_1 [Eumeta japonica]|uniref:Uncharacterized protein n=1 Tax=Eumeta variegata TaxID=151549 RepID=A0A4C1SW29_EUMVA|nr:hypothetical protein EVAR_4542_1 [Eumeta japonica]